MELCKLPHAAVRCHLSIQASIYYSFELGNRVRLEAYFIKKGLQGPMDLCCILLSENKNKQTVTTDTYLLGK